MWIGPLVDGVWVYSLVGAGAAFLMPPPPGDSGEPVHRFIEAVSKVVERQLVRPAKVGSDVPHAVAELVDAVLHEADPELALGLLLQLAAGVLSRGAVMMVDETAFRCRAGFGYPLNPAATALPRGVGLLERIVRSGEAMMPLDPEAAGSLQLARVVGVPRLRSATALIPLGSGGSIVGVLVGDRGDHDLPELGELVLLARRLGGFLIRA